MIKITNITKTFDDFTAVDSLSLQVDNSSIYGLVGYNGAGKTTLLKMIAGVYTPDSGTVELDGVDLLNTLKRSRSFSTCPMTFISVYQLQ